MKDRYVWFWGVAAAFFILAGFLLTGNAWTQEGEGEGENEGTTPCTLMDLTTQQAYTLPVLPPLLNETLTYYYPDDGALKAQVWVKVLQYSEHPADKFTVKIDDVEIVSLTNWGLIDTWQALDLDLPAPGSGSYKITIESVTRTDLPDYKPTLVLVGAVLIGTSSNYDEFTDTLASFGYSSNFGSSDLELKSILSVGSTGVLDDKPWNDSQNRFARLGGLTRPRIAASLRHEFVATGEGEGEGEGESEGEGEVELQGWLRFLYGDEKLCCEMSFQEIEDEDASFCNSADCEGYLQWQSGECQRVSMFIPLHLLGSAQRPALRINLDSADTGSRLIVDNFTLTYVSQALERAIPALVNMGNLIENGNFENGEYPFVIQSPTGQTNCARITDVIRDIDDACNGDAAAVFDGQVSSTPMVAYCEADSLVGRGQTGTLALYGLNLEYITDVLLIPQSYAGEPFDTGRYITLAGPSDIEYVGDLERVTYTFRFNGPFNVSAGGESICTDGLASFEYTGPGMDRDSEDTGTCTTLIDTLAPVLVVNSPEGVNAAIGWPAVYDTNRTPAPLPPGGPDFPPSWILKTPASPDFTPKNAASFTRQDMHVYLNAGSRVNLMYAEGSQALDSLYFSVYAYFVDPAPTDSQGNVYPVQQSGFRAAFWPEAAAEGEPTVAHPSQWLGGSVRWARANSDLQLVSLAAIPSLDPANEMNVTWQVKVEPVAGRSWSTQFKFEAVDRAGNLLDISKNNAINIHWQWQTRAVVEGALNMAEHAPELPWHLVTTELPGAPPACAPLARFRLYLEDATSGGLSLLGSSPWLQGPLRDTTQFSLPGSVSKSLRQWVNDNKGGRIRLDIIGADETGNVQYDPGPAGTIDDITDNNMDDIRWEEEVRDYRNEALDTALRVRLFEEGCDPALDPAPYLVTDFGNATRVPLPRIADACNNRVNGYVWFRATVPAQSGGNVAILWKFYKDGTLSARGVTVPNWNDNPNTIMGMLMSCSPGFTVDELLDYDTSNVFITEFRSIARYILPDPFLRLPPDLTYCRTDKSPCETSDFSWRLGDEGNPPNETDPNRGKWRRREIHYLLTAQTVINGTLIDTTPATARFSVYVPETEEAVRDEMPVREYSR